MKTLLTLLGATLLTAQFAQAIIVIPRDYPIGSVTNGTASGRDHAANLISHYRNDVVLLANPEKSLAPEIQNLAASPAAVEKLKALATSGGTALDADSLAAAVSAMVRLNPDQAGTITASAMNIMADLPGGLSEENRLIVGRAAIRGLPDNYANKPEMISQIVGVTVRGLKQRDSTKIVRSLREYAIGEVPVYVADYKGGAGNDGGVVDGGMTPDQASTAYAIDQSLVENGILSPFSSTPEFLVLADNFAADQLGNTFFSGDQGVIDQGQFFSPGAVGSPGGVGSSEDQLPNPTPGPTPPPPAS